MAVPAIPDAGKPWLTWAQGVDAEARKVADKVSVADIADPNSTGGAALRAAFVAVAQVDIRNFLLPGETLDSTGATSIHVLLGRARDALAALYVNDSRPRQISFPPGRYRIDTRLTWASGVGIAGESRDAVIFLPQANQSFIHQNSGSRNDDCLFSDFTIDGAAQVDSVYTAQVKGLYITRMRRARFERVTIKNVWSSGFGVDYLDQSWIIDCLAQNCGRGIKVLAVDPATTSGGSGFGIGSGDTAVETLHIVNCQAIDNALHGFFTEKQNSVSYYSRGFTMTGCTAVGNWIGFRDCGSIGANIQGNQFLNNGLCGVSLDKTILAANAGQDGSIASNIITGNGALAGSAPGGGVVIAQAALGGYSVRGNEISSNTGPGINVPAGASLADRHALRGNRIHDNTGVGITVKVSTSLLSIIDNELWNNGGYAVDLSGTGLTATGLRMVGNDGRSGGFNLGHALAGTYKISGNDGLDSTAITIAASGSGANAIDLTWNLPLDSSGITDYDIQYRLGTATTWTSWTHTASTSRAATITGLTHGVTYQVQIAAKVGSTVGPYSMVAAAAGAKDIADNFDRSDIASLTSQSAIDGATPAAYSVSSSNSGAMGRVGGRLKATSGAAFAHVPASADGSARLRFDVLNPTVANRRAALLFRYVDLSNYWRVVARPTSAELRIGLVKTVAGTATVVSTHTAQATSGDEVIVEYRGSTITWYLNSQLIGTVTDSALSTGTKVGANGDFVTDPISAMDNLAIWTS